MTKTQIKILKHLYRKPRTIGAICDKFNISKNTEDDELYSIFDNEFEELIDFDKDRSDYFNSVVSLNNIGESYIYNLKRSDLRWYVTTIIAVLALLGAFKEQVFHILQQLMQLLTGLMEN